MLTWFCLSMCVVNLGYCIRCATIKGHCPSRQRFHCILQMQMDRSFTNITTALLFVTIPRTFCQSFFEGGKMLIFTHVFSATSGICTIPSCRVEKTSLQYLWIGSCLLPDCLLNHLHLFLAGSLHRSSESQHNLLFLFTTTETLCRWQILFCCHRLGLHPCLPLLICKFHHCKQLKLLYQSGVFTTCQKKIKVCSFECVSFL